MKKAEVRHSGPVLEINLTKLLYVNAPDRVQIALHTLGDSANATVLLVPGTFSNATFWLGTKGVGFARTLADAGYYACVMEPRGHGQSARPQKGDDWDIDDWARLDLPTALREIASPDKPCAIVAHSAGGAITLAALVAEAALRQYVSKIVIAGTPLPWLQPWRGVGAWLIRLISASLGRFPARLLRLGPEDELPHVMSQWMTWNLKGHWIGDGGVDYTTGLSQLQMPFLVIAATADHMFAPPRACEALFEEIGSTQKKFIVIDGLDHVSMIVSKRARSEVWPTILTFLAGT